MGQGQKAIRGRPDRRPLRAGYILRGPRLRTPNALFSAISTVMGVRKAIANALPHRDYTTDTAVEVNVCMDFVER